MIISRLRLAAAPHRLSRRLFAALLVTFLFLPALPLAAQENNIAATAESLRAALFEAQMALPRDSNLAQVAFERAQDDFAALAVSLPPATRAAGSEGFAAAQRAVVSVDLPAFAAARARIWTGLLQGSASVVEEAVLTGDAPTAAHWLLVREFRQATRFARPNADATLAIKSLDQGTVDAAAALTAVRADLWDTYQARLNQALADLANADQSGFSTRRAEAAALANGYFKILAPAYAQQRGDDAARIALRKFSALEDEAISGRSVAGMLLPLHTVLDGFRAAPLGPAERNRRAGQLLRFLPLVAVEYARGVHGGQVTRDLEVREAITFAEGAAAAFTDLRDQIGAIDSVRAGAVAKTLNDLQSALEAAATHSTVARPGAIQAQVDSVAEMVRALIPAEWQVRNNAADFDVVRTSLDQMEAAARSGDYELAESARLDAYAMLESGPEARLTAFAPQSIPPLEALFWQGQGDAPGLAHLIAQNAPPDQIAATHAALNQQLAVAQAAIAGQMAPQAVASNAALIVFREGLEAVLILASLLASLRVGEQRRMRTPLWSGVLVALGATLLTWFLAHGMLTSLARYGEKLEAVVSVIAVAMLLLILNWFFHDVYWKGWMAGFHQRKQRIIRGHTSQWLGLIVLGFTSIYREGFETVIFLQAMVLEAGTSAVLTGVAVGLGMTVLLGLAVFGLQARLPHKKMLVVTGVLIGAVLLQMVGNMVHTFQVVGWLPTHPIRWLAFPYWTGLWFGVYSTWEEIGLQLLAAAFTIGSYVAAERMHGHNVRLWPWRSVSRSATRTAPQSARNHSTPARTMPLPQPAVEKQE